MFFSIKTDKKFKDLTKYKIISNARRTICLFPKSTDEVALDKYLFDNYKTNLQLMCLKLLNNINISFNSEDTLTITFKDKKLDNIATLITYGNGKLQGSDILKYAFGRY